MKSFLWIVSLLGALLMLSLACSVTFTCPLAGALSLLGFIFFVGVLLYLEGVSV